MCVGKSQKWIFLHVDYLSLHCSCSIWSKQSHNILAKPIKDLKFIDPPSLKRASEWDRRRGGKKLKLYKIIDLVKSSSGWFVILCWKINLISPHAEATLTFHIDHVDENSLIYYILWENINIFRDSILILKKKVWTGSCKLL